MCLGKAESNKEKWAIDMCSMWDSEIEQLARTHKYTTFGWRQ